jgi:6,7-dimethyl-8-ribityllumazine synthase
MSANNKFNFSLENYNITNNSNLKIGIVVSEWNSDITNNLLSGTVKELIRNGLNEKNISVNWVPGSFELIYGCKHMLKKNFNAIIAIGCVIKGDTDHYEYICSSISNGIMQLNIESDIPVIFCVLTDQNKTQSTERSGGKHGNKGTEAAIAAIKMASFK